MLEGFVRMPRTRARTRVLEVGVLLGMETWRTQGLTHKCDKVCSCESRSLN